MALPKIVVPEYTLTLPSDSKKKIKYRPFLVKEERLLLTALETADEKGNDTEVILRDATNRTIRNCTFDKVDIDSLAEFDVEYIFLNIRSKSRGATVKPTYTCRNDVKNVKCGTEVEIPLNLDEVKVIFPEKDLSKVMINDNLGIKFKYLTSIEKHAHDSDKDEVSKLFKIIVDSIDYIFDEESVYKGSETPKNQLVEFIESMDEKTFEKVTKYFDSQPTLRHTLKFDCPKCGWKQDIKLEGLESFFDLA